MQARHKAIFGRAMQGLIVHTHRLAFASVLLALPYKARFGGAVKRFTFRAHGLAFAGLCQGGADKRDEFPSPHGFAHAEDYIGYGKNSTFWIENCAVGYA